MKDNAAFQPGFRLSELDVGLIMVVFVFSPVVGRFFEPLGIAMLFTLVHFFLFCNVLRAVRLLELVWAAAFVALWSSSYLSGVPSWAHSYALSFAVSVVVTAVQVRLPSYHGVFWKVLNPRLPQWWEEQTGTKA